MRTKRVATRTLKTLAVACVLCWSLFPIVLIVLSSFKFNRDIFSPVFRIDFEATLSNYVNLWNHWDDFFIGLLNSTIITSGATILAVIASTLAGYGYSRYRSTTLSASVFFLIVVRLFPPIVLTLPLFPVANWLGIIDTHFILIILYSAFFVSLGTLVMRTFIDQIPVELDEAAKIDGANQFHIIRRVIFPLSGQGMVAIAVFVVVAAWNEFTFAFIFTTTNARTAPLVLSQMMGDTDGVDWGVLFAASTVQLLPVLLFVVFAQKQLIAGLTAGATKG